MGLNLPQSPNRVHFTSEEFLLTTIKMLKDTGKSMNLKGQIIYSGPEDVIFRNYQSNIHCSLDSTSSERINLRLPSLDCNRIKLGQGFLKYVMFEGNNKIL